LVEFFRRELNARFNKSIRLVTHEAMRALAGYSWPGNVRELRHALEHAFVVAEGPVITRADLPKHFAPAQPRSRRPAAAAQDNASKRGPRQGRKKNSPSASEEAEEKPRILQALEQTGWNRSKAAVLLNMHRATLWRKLALYGIGPPKNGVSSSNPS
jgi:DNA-binding NtrC family response regulator